MSSVEKLNNDISDLITKLKKGKSWDPDGAAAAVKALGEIEMLQRRIDACELLIMDTSTKKKRMPLYVVKNNFKSLVEKEFKKLSERMNEKPTSALSLGGVINKFVALIELLKRLAGVEGEPSPPPLSKDRVLQDYIEIIIRKINRWFDPDSSDAHHHFVGYMNNMNKVIADLDKMKDNNSTNYNWWPNADERRSIREYQENLLRRRIQPQPEGGGRRRKKTVKHGKKTARRGRKKTAKHDKKTAKHGKKTARRGKKTARRGTKKRK